VLLGAITGWSLLAPQSAQAISLNPLNLLSPVTNGLSGVGAGIFVRGFVAILNSLFSGAEAKLTLQVLTWLTSVGDQSGGRITSLYGFTSGMALGLLGAVVTVSIVRYWVAGLSMSGSGGFEALEGLLRSIGAVGFLLIWPFTFGQLVALSNICSATILGDPALRADIAHLIDTVVFVTFTPGGGISLFLGVVVAAVGGILFIALLFLKVLLGAAVTFLYVAMPLACIVWPIEEASWLARYGMRAFIALLVAPVVWALIFATFAAVSVNALSFQGAHGFVNQVTQPLVAIAMLWMTITIPRTLFKLASGSLGLGRHGGGFFSRAGSYMIARQAGEGLAYAGVLPFGKTGFVSGPRSGPSDPGAGGSGRGPYPSGGSGGGGGGSGGGLGTSGSPSTGIVGAGAASDIEAVRAAARKLADGTATHAEQEAGDVAGGSTAPTSGAADTRPVQRARTEPPVPEGHELALGASVGPTRPQRGHPSPIAALPPSDASGRKAHTQALLQARSMPPPSLEDAHAASRRLGADVLTRMTRDFELYGGAPEVAGLMARLSTSDQISNEQAADFMTLASASGHPPTLASLLGIAQPDARQSGSAGGGSGATPISSQSARSPQPYRPSVTEGPLESQPPERSPDVRTRDEAWRRSGPHGNSGQD
jgi:uncharacterized membrane protein YgcG